MADRTGQRVRLKASDADGWKQPYKRFAETGRGATVTGRQGHDGPWVVSFDVLRGSGRPHTVMVHEACFFRDLEAIPTLATPSDKEGGE